MKMYLSILTMAVSPVEISLTQPEDELYGRNVKRPTDYADPDPPLPWMISLNFFQKPRENQLLPAPLAVAN